MFDFFEWKPFPRLFIKLFEFTRKSCFRVLIITNNIESWKPVKEFIINIFFTKNADAPPTRQDFGEFIFQQDCHSALQAGHASFLTYISQGSVATRLGWGGIFNDRFIFRRMWQWKKKIMKIGQYLTKLSVQHESLLFLAHPVHQWHCQGVSIFRDD